MTDKGVHINSTTHPEEIIKVSVVMCTYNGGSFLEEQLKSIVNQTYPIHELIIQDDGSTDDTEAIANKYEQDYNYIHFYRNKQKKGINDNFFSAMRRATGEVIAISDQDDIWELKKIEWQVNALKGNWLVGSMSRPFSTDGTLVDFDARVPNIHLLRMLYVGMIPGHTQLLRRELLDLLPKRSDFMYDQQLQVIAAAANKIAYIPQVLVNQRRYLNAATYCAPINRERSLKNAAVTIANTVKMYRKLRPSIRKHFHDWMSFFDELNIKNPTVSDAYRMSQLQVKRSFWGWIQLTGFCIQHRDKLFHVKETNKLLAIARGAYFPFYCTTYFRYLLYKKES